LLALPIGAAAPAENNDAQRHDEEAVSYENRGHASVARSAPILTWKQTGGMTLIGHVPDLPGDSQGHIAAGECATDCAAVAGRMGAQLGYGIRTAVFHCGPLGEMKTAVAGSVADCSACRRARTPKITFRKKFGLWIFPNRGAPGRNTGD
jgi:hypothetical protein